jgi:hypothetical protein
MMKGETVLTGAPHPGTELEVMQSPGMATGYYLGFREENGMPYSRETDYMPKDQAEFFLSRFRKVGKGHIMTPDEVIRQHMGFNPDLEESS